MVDMNNKTFFSIFCFVSLSLNAMHLAHHNQCNHGRIKQAIIEKEKEPVLFYVDQPDDITKKSLPKELNEKIFSYMTYDSCAETLQGAAQFIRVLACTNTFLNAHINETEKTFKIIKNFSRKFQCPNMIVARDLRTQAARRIYGMQNGLLLDWNRLNRAEWLNGYIIIMKPIGLDLNFSDEHGMTPLSRALVIRDFGYGEVAPSLIQNGADILICDDMGRNALMLALQKGKLLAIKEILSGNKELDIHHQDKYQNTVLHHWYDGFISKGYLNDDVYCEILECLLKTNNIDPTIKNSDNKTLLDLIKACDFLKSLQRKKLVDLLEKAEGEFKGKKQI